MEPIIVTRKPCKCPKCGGKVVKLVYGEPGPELFEMADRKEVVLGGCCIHSDELISKYKTYQYNDNKQYNDENTQL